MTNNRADTRMTATAAPSTRTLASSILQLPDGEENDDNYSVGLKQLESFLWLNASRLNHWVEEQKATVDAQAERHRQEAMREQSHLDKLHHDLLSIRLDQSLCLDKNDNDEDEGEEVVDDDDTTNGDMTTKKEANRAEIRLVKEQEQVEADLERVQEVTNHKKVEIQELEKRIAERREQVGHEQQWLASIQHSKTVAHTELARVVHKYRALGLVFDPARVTRDDDDNATASNALRFAFTLLDVHDPDRRFEFTLATTNDDEKGGGAVSGDDEGGSYELLDCDPILSPRHAELEMLAQELNDTDDMAPFIGRMRELFVEEIAKEHVNGTVG